MRVNNKHQIQECCGLSGEVWCGVCVCAHML